MWKDFVYFMENLANKNSTYISELLHIQWLRDFWDSVFPKEIKHNLRLQEVFVNYCLESDVVIYHSDCDETNNSSDNLYLMYRPEYDSITPVYLYKEYGDYVYSILKRTDKSGYYLSKYLCRNLNDEISNSVFYTILHNFTIWKLPEQEDPYNIQKALNDYSTNFVWGYGERWNAILEPLE